MNMRALALALLALASPAAAQDTVCNTVEAVHAVTASFGEVLLGSGPGIALIDPSKPFLFEFWLDPEDGSWTIVSILDGQACIEAAGPAWRFGETGVPS